MDTTPLNVRVEPIDGHQALRFTWERRVDGAAVSNAFKQITNCLNQSDSPVHVLVDITANPRFPLQETMHSLLNGPMRHPKMGLWLVIGANTTARFIGRFTVKMGQRQNVYWFDREGDAMAYLAELEQQEIAGITELGCQH